MLDLSGKTAFITGGAGGIGLGMALAFGREGMKVMIADIEAEPLTRGVERLRGEGIAADGVVVDVASRTSVQRAALQTIAAFGKVHIVCNNAGVGVAGRPGEVTMGDWDWILDVNLYGVIHGAEVFVPLIESHGEGGHIINTSSMAGVFGAPGSEPYAATKFAVLALTEGWARQLAKRNIGVSALCPGIVSTGIAYSRRNRPADYGPESPVEGDVTRSEDLRRQIAAGPRPERVGRRVVEAVKAGELYIFTDTAEHYRAIARARFDAILAAFDRAERSPVLSSLPARPSPDVEAPGLL